MNCSNAWPWCGPSAPAGSIACRFPRRRWTSSRSKSWPVKYVRGGEVVVSNAQGAPATIPFWLGEAPGRTVELSAEVARLREELAARISPDSRPDEAVIDWLMRTGHIGRAGAEQ